jgi:putative addiction module antidote
MHLELKLRKIGNSVGFVLPKEALARLEANEGDTVVFTEAPGGGYRLTPNKSDFAGQMAVAKDVADRYRNALRELAK